MTNSQDKFTAYRDRKKSQGMVLLRCWVPSAVAVELDRIGPTRGDAIEVAMKALKDTRNARTV